MNLVDDGHQCERFSYMNYCMYLNPEVGDYVEFDRATNPNPVGNPNNVTNIVLIYASPYAISRVIPRDQLNAGDLPKLTEGPCKYVVKNFGTLPSLVHTTDAAYAELCRLASYQRGGEKWPPARMKNYLDYTWLRLIEQERVQLIYAERFSPAQEGMEQLGLTSQGLPSMLVVFRPGLVYSSMRPLECICTYNTSSFHN